MNGYVGLSGFLARLAVVVIASEDRLNGTGDYPLSVPKLIERAFDFGLGISVYAPDIRN